MRTWVNVETIAHLLADHQPLLIATLLALGAAIGHVSVRGVRIGPAAVLFAAIAVSALSVSAGVHLEPPEAVGTLGLILFTYTIGVISGYQFFSSVRRGWPIMLGVAAIFLGAAALALALGSALGLSRPVIAGAFAGALTNTPALAAASAAAGSPSEPTIGYSITYLGGVIVMLAASAWSLARPGSRARRPGVTHLTVRVETDERPSIEALVERYDGRITVSRVKHLHAANPAEVPADNEVVGRNDLITLVGPRPLLEQAAHDLGHISSHNIVAERDAVDYRRITLSNKRFAGRSIAETGLEQRYGAAISRVRRGDIDMVAGDDFVLQMGDRLRVIAPSEQMDELSAAIGDSERGMSDINVGGLSLGLTLGVLLGLVHIPLPGAGFTIGAAAGTLLVGLVFGRVGRLGPVVTSMSNGAAQSLSAIGMVLFLAYAGVRAGESFVSALTSDAGWRIAVLGLVVTAASAVALVALSMKPGRRDGVVTSGLLAGAQTQPALLAFANERTSFDARVGIGYALVYPAAMITKILLAQLMVGLS